MLKLSTITLAVAISSSSIAQTFIDAPSNKDFKTMPNGILYKSVKKGNGKVLPEGVIPIKEVNMLSELN